MLYTTCIHMQKQNTGENNTGGLCCSGMNGLLIPDFGSSTRGERHNSYYANHPRHAAYLVMFKISVGQNSTLNSLFQNTQILRTISFGHDVIHTPAPFPVWGLL